MSNTINKLLILALGIALGVIFMLVRERPSTAPSAGSPSPPRGNVVQVAPSSSPAPTPSVLPAPSASLPETPLASDEEPTPRQFQAQMERVLKGEADDDEQLAFWQSIRTSKQLDALITQLQTTVAADAEDIQSRLSLAQAYITKLWGSAAGPAQGIWAGKAEAAWKEVLELDPANWDAQRNIAFSYSQYPDFLNKTGAAIREYEKTIQLQEQATEVPGGFSKTYLELAKLQHKNGDPSGALVTLQKGVAVHPESEELAAQLKVIESSYKFEN